MSLPINKVVGIILGVVIFGLLAFLAQNYISGSESFFTGVLP
ncbi:MAG: hypothetical protein V5A72_03025 [Candidatus Nanohaloarchaea archaeon]